MTIRHYRTLAQASLRGKRVLLRAGFDVPIENGVVTDATRIQTLIPTMRFILDQGALLVLLSHQGRPKGAPDPQFSQAPLVPILEKFLGTKVHFASDCIGPVAEKVVAQATPGQVVLLENLRFHDAEKKNDPAFAKALAQLGDVYVNDAFTNCHREHASMVGLARLLPSYMGLQLEHEVSHLAPVLDAPVRPLALVISGAKMETKVPVVRRFLTTGDDILLGGCVANTFIAAQGQKIGASKFEQEFVNVAKELLGGAGKGKAKIHVPTDVVVAPEISETAPLSDVPVGKIPENSKILDLGSETLDSYIAAIEKAKTVIWNGPLGLSELEHFASGTKRLAAAIAAATKRGAITIIGGGDTLDFHARYGFPLDAYTFFSTGGGAMLEFLAGEEFASLQALAE